MDSKLTKLECKITDNRFYSIFGAMDTTLGYLDEGDAKILKDNLEQIGQLIIENPFFEKISFLLKNRDLAHKEVNNMHGEMRRPNCIGTALWIAGKTELDYPYHGYEDCLERVFGWHEIHNGYWRSKFSEENATHGAMVLSCYHGDWHAGIYLGKVNEDHITFCKQGHDGAPFGPASFRYYARPKFYPFLIQKH